MPGPLLLTKLYIPPPRPKIVSRPRLIERLNEGLRRKLTLISASAGFGKTTLVSEWVAGCGLPVVWLSLDEGDSDPTRFLTYLVAALQTLTPVAGLPEAGLPGTGGLPEAGGTNIGAGVLAVLQSPQPPPIESILTALLNEITTIQYHFVLVLDDYHAIDAKPVDSSKSVDAALIFLLEHLPPQMHLVITTREDPHLPLARYRARGQLTELRAADLRFSPAEAAEFLNQVMGLNLSVEDISTLESRAEGWIAGLQLAALSMQGNKDVSGFIREFAGDHRYIVDYLVEEVLDSQPETMRRFLLQTSILDRLNGPLCDAVCSDGTSTGKGESNARLEALQRGNFFVIPLDDRRAWYRYHHLFADVLRMRLTAEQPDQVPALHRRASEWFEHNGSAPDAIRHALAAKDFERAAGLIELAVPEMRRNRQGATVTELGWLKAIPDELVHFRPVLSVAYAFALIGGGEVVGAEARLRDAERWLNPAADTAGTRPEVSRRMVVVDEEEFRRLPGMIALLRGAQALARGDMLETVKNARRVLELAPVDAHLMLGGAASQLGLAAWASGDLEAASRMTADGIMNVRLAGYISSAIGGSIVLADIQIAQGHLHEAMITYERGLQWATGPGSPAQRGAADMHVGMSALYREYNDLQTAAQHLLTSQALGDLAGLPQNPYRWHAAMARVREAQGDLDGALNLLEQAERLYNSGFSPNVRPIPARKVRVWAAQGRLGEALGWAHDQGLSVDDDLSYLREFEHITLARVLLAHCQSDHVGSSMAGVVGLLERLLKAAEEGGRKGSVIEILVLQALALQAMADHVQGDLAAALLPLQHALALAEPEGYVRIFLDEGPSMMDLLKEVSAREKLPRQGLPTYTDTLLAAFEAEKRKNEAKPDLLLTQPRIEPGSQPAKSTLVESELRPAKSTLVEALSERELEVLKLLRSELSGPEIAQQLSVSLYTLRTHTNHIYQKLGVNNRRAAVRRAEELDLL